MLTFNYTIKDELGIHARPAGMLVKESAKYQSSIKMKAPLKEVDTKKIMAVMSAGVRWATR